MSLIHVGRVNVTDCRIQFADGLTILSRLPPSSEIATDMSNAAVGMLYNTVPHPPASFLGPVHSWRSADGGGNNLQVPDCGRGGTAYARSVQGQWCLAAESLPDPGLIFDTLLKKRVVRT